MPINYVVCRVAMPHNEAKAQSIIIRLFLHTLVSSPLPHPHTHTHTHTGTNLSTPFRHNSAFTLQVRSHPQLLHLISLILQHLKLDLSALVAKHTVSTPHTPHTPQTLPSTSLSVLYQHHAGTTLLQLTHTNQSPLTN